MKARLLSGKYYRREEDGRMKRYTAGSILEISPTEARRLDVREEIISPSPSTIKRATSPKKVDDKKEHLSSDDKEGK